MLRWLTAGESHGPSLVAILEGLPAHVEVTSDDIADALARRRLGYGRGARMKFEQDEVTLVGGVRHGETQGGPVAIQIGNTEWPKWEKVMASDPVDPVELEALARVFHRRHMPFGPFLLAGAFLGAVFPLQLLTAYAWTVEGVTSLVSSVVDAL